LANNIWETVPYTAKSSDGKLLGIFPLNKMGATYIPNSNEILLFGGLERIDDNCSKKVCYAFEAEKKELKVRGDLPKDEPFKDKNDVFVDNQIIVLSSKEIHRLFIYNLGNLGWSSQKPDNKL